MVYIVYEKPQSYYYDGDTVEAVFSSMEKAEDFIKSKSSPKHFFLEVWKVDE